MKQTLTAFLFLLLTACHSQEAEINLSQYLKTPNFKSPNTEKLDKLKIPYRQNNLYGLCDYNFEIILKPQFEDIEIPDPLFNYFKAKKNGAWSIYDFSGQKILPIESLENYKIKNEIIFIGDDVLKRPDLSLYISKIKDPISRALTFSKSNAVEDLHRYYYLSKAANFRDKAWFEPNYKDLFNRSEYYNTKFTLSFQYGYIKVMDEHQKFTLLDQEGQAIFEPVLNCAAISPTKIMLLNTDGKCAVWDVNKGWTTDYSFIDVKRTANPNILIGQVSDKGSPSKYYLIDSLGQTTAMSTLEDYIPINNEFSLIKNNTSTGNNNFILYNERTAKNIRNLSNYKLNNSFNEIGFSIEKNNKIIGIETIHGDTILSPDADYFSFLSDSIYYFKQANKQGLANLNGTILYEIPEAQMNFYNAEYYKIKSNKKYGLVNLNGDEIFPPDYNLLFHQPDVDRAITRMDKKHGYYEWSTGKELIPMKLNYLANTFLPYQSGACVELKANNDRYILNSNLEIRYQSSKTPIIDKSHFSIGEATKEIQDNFNKSRLPKSFPNYVIFNGDKMVHIFQCDGTYIRSIMDFKYYERNFKRTADIPFPFAESIVNYGIAEFKDVQNASFWVRLKDGMVYQRD